LDLDAYEGQKDRYRHAHRDRVQLWRSYLQRQAFPKDRVHEQLVREKR
jgi:hypothetical protein